jgi:hypothetical protein
MEELIRERGGGGAEERVRGRRGKGLSVRVRWGVPGGGGVIGEWWEGTFIKCLGVCL